MNSDVRNYLAEVVRVIEMRHRHRSRRNWRKWEKRLLDGAKKLLLAEQAEFGFGPLFEPRPTTNAQSGGPGPGFSPTA